jgi:short-subunit dehydrogenase
MENRLRGKVVVITGASVGIGELVARKVAEKDATPVVIARTAERLSSLCEEIRNETGVSAMAFPFDVRKIDEMEGIFQSIYQKAGRIDIVVNNAGFGVFDELKDADLSIIKEMFEVNVLGLIASTKAALPYLLQQENGHIINIASQAGKLATPKSSGYSATKHAVLGFTNSLRLELADTNVSVSAVNPGPIRTRFFDIADKSGNYVKNIEKYMLEPEFVAEKIVQLMEHPKRELNLPGWMNAGSVMYQLFPRLVEKLAARSFKMK